MSLNSYFQSYFRKENQLSFLQENMIVKNWTKDESQLLAQLVGKELSRSEVIDWDHITPFFEDRSLEDLQLMYLRKKYLEVSDCEPHHSWEPEELRLIKIYAETMGRTWSHMSKKVFPWLTAPKLKNKFYAMQREEKQGPTATKRGTKFESLAACGTESDNQIFDQIQNILKDLF